MKEKNGEKKDKKGHYLQGGRAEVKKKKKSNHLELFRQRAISEGVVEKGE